MNSKKAEFIRWQPIVARYAKPDKKLSLLMLANTLIPYFVLWGLMIWSIQVLLLDHSGAGHPGSGVPDADLYHLPRLRAWFVLQVEESQ